MWLTFDFKMCLSKFSVLAPVIVEIHHVILEILTKSTRKECPVHTLRLHKGLTVHAAWGGTCRDPYTPSSWK